MHESTPFELPDQYIARIESKAAAVYDDDGRLVYVTPMFQRLVGSDCRGALGKEPPHPWWPREGAGLAGPMLQAFRTRRAAATLRALFVGADGKPIPLDASYRPLIGTGEGPVFHVIEIRPRRASDRARIDAVGQESVADGAPPGRAAKALCWLTTPLGTAPISAPGRWHAGYLLRKMQRGVRLWRTESRPVPNVGKNCHEVQVRDPESKATWRIVCRVHRGELIVVGWHDRSRMPAEFADACRRRLREYSDQSAT